MRNIIFWIHLITGLIVGVVIFTMAATGILMAYEPQIVAYAERNLRNVKAPSLYAARLSLDAIVAKARERHPQAQPSSVTLRSSSESSVYVQMGRGISAYHNPYTGEYLGSRSKAYDWMRAIEDIHRKLSIGETGRKVTGAVNVAFFLMILTGLYIWWPKKWIKPNLRTIMFFNDKLRGKARDWNWHNVFGIWCAPLLLVTTLTGLVMSYPWANDFLYRIAGNAPPSRMIPTTKTEGAQVKPVKINYDQLLAAVDQQAPGWKALTMRIPQSIEAPVNVSIEEANASKFFMKSQLSLDSKTAKVIKWEPFHELPLGRQLRFWVLYVHTGRWADLSGQTLALTGAVGACFLVWTGFSLAWYRFFNLVPSKKPARKGSKISS